MARSNRKQAAAAEMRRTPQPVSKDEYIRVARESCRHGRCCQDPAQLDAAYAQYVNNPRAPWNKNRRR
jgi:hypothetical protein